MLPNKHWGIKEIKRKTKEFLETNENSTIYWNSCDMPKAILRRKVIAIITHINKFWQGITSMIEQCVSRTHVNKKKPNPKLVKGKKHLKLNRK